VNKVININAARTLIAQYRGITVGEVNNWLLSHSSISRVDFLTEKTGFNVRCCLCIEAGAKDLCCDFNGFVKGCIYLEVTGKNCCSEENAKTFDNIFATNNNQEFVQAVHQRADHIENLISRYEDARNTDKRILERLISNKGVCDYKVNVCSMCPVACNSIEACSVIMTHETRLLVATEIIKNY